MFHAKTSLIVNPNAHLQIALSWSFKFWGQNIQSVAARHLDYILKKTGNIWKVTVGHNTTWPEFRLDSASACGIAWRGNDSSEVQLRGNGNGLG